MENIGLPFLSPSLLTHLLPKTIFGCFCAGFAPLSVNRFEHFRDNGYEPYPQSQFTALNIGNHNKTIIHSFSRFFGTQTNDESNKNWTQEIYLKLLAHVQDSLAAELHYCTFFGLIGEAEAHGGNLHREEEIQLWTFSFQNIFYLPPICHESA